MSVHQHFLASAVLVLVAGHPSTTGVAAQSVLARTTALKCDFPIHAVGTWQDGEATAEVKTSKLAVAFESVNTQDSFAKAVGAFGPSDIVVRLSAGNLHFVQVNTSGSLYVTTVFNKETRLGRLQAVHTRHEYTQVSLPGFTSRPEQYYGECEVEQSPPR